jgi:hypothetical protein
MSDAARATAEWFASRGRREITILLFVSWDPIGVNDESEQWREYESYAEPIMRCVLDGRSDADLAQMLTRIAREEMGLDWETDETDAATIRRWILASHLAWKAEQGDDGARRSPTD